MSEKSGAERRKAIEEAQAAVDRRGLDPRLAGGFVLGAAQEAEPETTNQTEQEEQD